VNQLELRYVAHVTTLTGRLRERYGTAASSVRDLLVELDRMYPGFQALFVNPRTQGLNLNSMIYVAAPGEIPISVIDLEQPLEDGGIITFW
jgi:hypothetical protein